MCVEAVAGIKMLVQAPWMQKNLGEKSEGVWAVRWSRLFGQLDDGARSSVSAKRSEAKVTLRVMGGHAKHASTL